MFSSIRNRGKECLRGEKQILGSSLGTGGGDCETWLEVAPGLEGLKVSVLLLDA